MAKLECLKGRKGELYGEDSSTECLTAEGPAVDREMIKRSSDREEQP